MDPSTLKQLTTNERGLAANHSSTIWTLALLTRDPLTTGGCSVLVQSIGFFDVPCMIDIRTRGHPSGLTNRDKRP